MESKAMIKKDIYEILDEIINLNDSILHSVCYGYSGKTRDGLDRYRMTLRDLNRELLHERITCMN